MILMVPGLLLIVGALALALAYNALHPRFRPTGLAVASFFAGWLTGELGLHLLLANLILVLGLVAGGGLNRWLGWLGLLLDLCAVALLWVGYSQSAMSRGVVAAALSDLICPDAPHRLDWRRLILPLPLLCPRPVERLRGVPYFDDGRLRLLLDIYRPREVASGRPVLLYVHGGAWIIGSRRNQGLPLLHRFAARGWVCFTIDYRLSPGATFPDHIVDVKRAIAWVREHARDYGGDPDCIVISGGSAGGHLASLAALTAGERQWQPGFEDADTTVAACISFYGVYDCCDLSGHWPNRGLHWILSRFVLKAPFEGARARYREASPLAHVSPQAPPFLVIHGACDSLVPVAEARAFVAALRQAGGRCTYIEVPGAQHAFEVFPSVRTLYVLDGVERFAAHVRAARTVPGRVSDGPLGR